MEKNHTAENPDMETRIVDTAREVFVEKGFTDASMSEIAARTGINRPALHYYFRTKEKMFHAVFGKIILSFVPRILDIVRQHDKPLVQRIEEVVDTYCNVFAENPDLPLFMIKEMDRDMDSLMRTVCMLNIDNYMRLVVAEVQEDMRLGRMRQVPLRTIFFTLYGLMAVPYLTRNLCNTVLLERGETFGELLEKWKPYVKMQLTNLLEVKAE